ncbi:MAG: hypothetical protein IJ011_00385 [Clostridia bacterium]|nr:hypothetical protein [Clostridia bacterium]
MKKTIRYLSAALAAASMLTLLAACGEQSAQGGETEEFISETYDSNGFESVDSTSDSVTESGDGNNESSTEAEDKDDDDTETGGSSGGTVHLPMLPI